MKRRPVSITIPDQYYDFIMDYYGPFFRTSLDTTVAHYLTNIALNEHFAKNKKFKSFLRERRGF